MAELLQNIVDYLQDNWVKFASALGMMAVGWFFGRRRAQHEWQHKEFLDRLNVSLNTLVDGKLLIRTLIEKSCSDVFINKVAAATVASISRQTTADNPVLPLPKSDYWYYLNAVLNEVAEKFADGAMKRDMGIPVRCERYLICLTNEAAGEIRTRKVRAMVIQKKLLTNLPAEQPKLESPTHSVRWQTLKTLNAIYAKSPERFLDVEICI